MVLEYVPSSVMLPLGRLGTLLGQAVQLQHSQCVHHIEERGGNTNLLQDHICQLSRLPSQPHWLVPAHHDEVWCLAFSHDGQLLASGAQDSSLRIWHSNPLSPDHTVSDLGPNATRPRI